MSRRGKRKIKRRRQATTEQMSLPSDKPTSNWPPANSPIRGTAAERVDQLMKTGRTDGTYNRSLAYSVIDEALDMDNDRDWYQTVDGSWRQRPTGTSAPKPRRAPSKKYRATRDLGLPVMLSRESYGSYGAKPKPSKSPPSPLPKWEPKKKKTDVVVGEVKATTDEVSQYGLFVYGPEQHGGWMPDQLPASQWARAKVCGRLYSDPDCGWPMLVVDDPKQGQFVYGEFRAVHLADVEAYVSEAEDQGFFLDRVPVYDLGSVEPKGLVWALVVDEAGCDPLDLIESGDWLEWIDPLGKDDGGYELDKEGAV